MAFLEEKDIFTDRIVELDVNNDVPNTQLANRTIWLKNRFEELDEEVTKHVASNASDFIDVKQSIADIKEQINNINEITDINEINRLIAKVDEVENQINILKKNVNNHSFNYAGSSYENGPAISVEVSNGIVNNLQLIGSSESENVTLKKNTNMYMYDDKLIAPIFQGDLDGNASTATKLQNARNIILTGDVISSNNEFDGSSDMVVNTVLKEQDNVCEGIYGPQQSELTVSASGDFKVPCITVNNKGIITSIVENKITLSEQIATNGTTSALPKNDKLYLLGAKDQTNSTTIYSQNGVFAQNGKLYSNNYEVINVSDTQQLTNKTYNGYTLKEACSRGVDDASINGIEGDNRLITSNCLARHTHNYAVSEMINGVSNGKAKYVTINKTLSNNDVMYLLGNNDVSGSIYKNTSIYYTKDTITAPNLQITDNAYIPGGKISIESVETPILASEYTPTVQKTTLDIDNARQVVLANSNIKVLAGDILSYQTGGYVLANNIVEANTRNLMLACTDAVGGTVYIVPFGTYETNNNSYDGYTCYLSTSGKFVYSVPSTGAIVKVGYMEGSVFIFNPTK